MASVLSETPTVSPSALSVPVQTIISGQGSQNYVPVGSQPRLFSGTSALLRFGSLSLNPNAEEFIPSALKVGKAINETSQKTTRNCVRSDLSDDEYRQYVHSQLPDDILPDFNASVEASIFSEQPLSAASVNDKSNTSNFHHPCSLKVEQAFVESTDKSLWQQPLKPKSALTVTSIHKPFKFTGNTSDGLKPKQFPLIIQPSLPGRATKPSTQSGVQVDRNNEAARKSTPGDIDPPTVGNIGPAESLNFLSTKFPNISVGNLADILFSYGGDLGLTVKMLIQVEDLTPPRQSQLSAAAAPYTSVTSIPPPPSLTPTNQHFRHLEDTEYRPLTANNNAEFFSPYWQQEGKRGADIFSSPVKPLHGSGEGCAVMDSRVPIQERIGQSIIKDLPIVGQQYWLETGDATAGFYPENRERVADPARMNRACYEQQARQAHMASKHVVAKELNEKGQWHGEQMKLGHIRAGDIIFQQNSCFINKGHTGQHSPLRPRNIFIH